MKFFWTFKNILEKIRLLKYNETTIENFFREKGCLIGTNNRIFIQSLCSEPFLVKIGDHCTITEGVKFITHDGGGWILRDEIPGICKFGKIEIKDNCYIGINSIILPNVTIGPNVIVGAGSVVTKDVPPNSVVAGVPARIICSTEDYKEKCIKEWRKLNLKGPIEEWKDQLINYFWTKNNSV